MFRAVPGTVGDTKERTKPGTFSDRVYDQVQGDKTNIRAIIGKQSETVCN